jgi:hypothetical protein
LLNDIDLFGNNKAHNTLSFDTDESSKYLNKKIGAIGVLPFIFPSGIREYPVEKNTIVPVIRKKA